jgi:hypothetical protein
VTSLLKPAADIPRDSSTEDLFEWASQNLARGHQAAELQAALCDNGWAPELAAYFVQRVEQARVPVRRQRGKSALVTGGAWLAGGLAAILAGHQLFGIWSTRGPLLVGWVVVACGCLRLAAGMVETLRCRTRSTASRTSRATRPPARWAKPNVSLELDLQALGLSGEVSSESAQRAYRQLVKAWHPDRFHTAGDLRERAERRMKLINASYARIRAQWRD